MPEGAVSPPPLGGGMTDSNREEVPGCVGVLAGRLGVWWQFRHNSTDLNHCYGTDPNGRCDDDRRPCSNSNVDHNGCADNSRAHDDHRRPHHHCGTDNDHRRPHHDYGTDNHHARSHHDYGTDNHSIS